MTAWVAILGGLAGVDRTAFGQTSLAHPFVAGSVCGLVVGAPLEGVRLAVVVMMLSAATIPVGEARLRDWTSAAIIGVALGAVLPPPGNWGAALVWAVLCARPAGWFIEAARRLAGGAMDRADRARERGDLGALERLHGALTGLHLLRGALVTLLGLLIGRWLLTGPVVGSEAVARWMAELWTLAPWAAVPLLLRVHVLRSGWSWVSVGAAGLALTIGLVEGGVR